MRTILPSYQLLLSLPATTDTQSLRYEVPHRIHAAKIYPVKAPNGSTIIIHAHERGINFAWRGGRPFKHPSQERVSSKKSPKVNGHNHEVQYAEMIDEDDNVDHNNTINTLDDFEPGEDERDTSAPYPPIIDSLDYELDSTPLHIAFPPLSTFLETDAGRQTDEPHQDHDLPRIFRRDVVIALTCRDASVHLVTVPLMPAQAGRAFQQRRRNIQDTIVSSAQTTRSLRSIPRSVTITWTLSPGLNDESFWYLLLATATTEGKGTLKVWGIRIDSDKLTEDAASLLCLDSLPAQPFKIAFKPLAYPSPHHTQLLLSDVQGAVRVYDIQPGVSPRVHVLTILRTPFQTSDSSSRSKSVAEGNIRILDACWVMSGACILVLLSNGQWGLWDIEGAGFSSSSGLLRGMGGGNSISGSALTPFSLRGFVGKKASSSGTSSRGSDIGGDLHPTGNPSPDDSLPPTQLAPMTPNTRKDKQGKLFSRETSSTPKVEKSANIVQGGLSVTAIPRTNSEARSDDSIVLWYNADVFSIPSLRSYWERAAKKTIPVSNKRFEVSSEGTLYGANVRPQSHITTGGQSIASISQVAQAGIRTQEIPGTLRSETLIATEHRLLFVRPHVEEHAHAERGLNRLFVPPAEAFDTAPTPRAPHADHDLLTRGELDLGGMDRMLNGMGSNPADDRDPFMMSGALQPAQRRVGFAVEY